MTKTIYTRKQVLVNTDPQRRCYNGCNFSEELQWTPWERLETTHEPEERLKFWKELSDYSVSVGGQKSEFELREEK